MKKETEVEQIPQRAALYARVSTDDQRERQTIDGQVSALRTVASHWEVQIIEEYLDDGVSGTVPMEKRPEGVRLVQDAKAGKFDVVIFYKLDRLGRSLRNILDIVDLLDGLGIGIKSMTENFDTTTPVGRFAVQMMASVGELERETILERTSLGRARVAKQGIWVSGAIPYGYLMNKEGILEPDREPRNGSPFSEAELVQRVFRHIGHEGMTAMEVARRFTEEGIPHWRKYQRRGQIQPTYKTKPSGKWWPSNIVGLVKSEIYKGIRRWDRDGENIVQLIEPLVDEETWDRAHRQLATNRRYPKSGKNHRYLLRGLIRCQNCGTTYSGFLNSNRGGWQKYYYRCGSQSGELRLTWGPCKGKLISADWIEELVWGDVKSFVSNPGPVIHQLKERMDSELGPVPDMEARKAELERLIAQKELEYDRVLDAYRHGLMKLDALEVHARRSKNELEPLQEELAALINMGTKVGQDVGRLTEAEHLLKSLQERIDGELDWDIKREILETLVWGITVNTKGEGHKKKAEVEVCYAFDPAYHAVKDGIS